MSFGSYLKRSRIARELTIRQCCAELGADPVYWSKLERGIALPPPAEELTKWADYLRVGRTELRALARMCVAQPDKDESEVAALLSGSDPHRGSTFDELFRESPEIRRLRTPEAFLGLAKTQTPAAMALALNISLMELRRAILEARGMVSKEFLRELDGPQPVFAAGAYIKDFDRQRSESGQKHE
jgi:transcriptional regulator with XRE-family HTH domain